MVGRVIRDYIEGGGKKLTVPGFGTFMRRDGGEVIFVDLLRGDDHVLSEMVEDVERLSEIEAMAKIDRFIFETKNAIARNGKAAIEGFGTMTVDHKGVYQFSYAPAPRPVRESAVAQKLWDKEPPQRHTPPQHSAAAPAQAARPEPASAAATPQRPAAAPRPESSPRQAAPQRPASAPRPTAAPRQSSASRQAAEPRHPAARQKYSRLDIIIIVAIAAAVVALAAMAYSLTVDAELPFLRR